MKPLYHSDITVEFISIEYKHRIRKVTIHEIEVEGEIFYAMKDVVEGHVSFWNKKEYEEIKPDISTTMKEARAKCNKMLIERFEEELADYKIYVEQDRDNLIAQEKQIENLTKRIEKIKQKLGK